LLLDLLSYAQIKPVVNQIEIHPFLPQEDLIQFCFKYKIQVEGFSPLANGKETAGKHKQLLDEPVLKELATKYNKTPG